MTELDPVLGETIPLLASRPKVFINEPTRSQKNPDEFEKTPP